MERTFGALAERPVAVDDTDSWLGTPSARSVQPAWPESIAPPVQRTASDLMDAPADESHAETRAPLSPEARDEAMLGAYGHYADGDDDLSLHEDADDVAEAMDSPATDSIVEGRATIDVDTPADANRDGGFDDTDPDDLADTMDAPAEESYDEERATLSVVQAKSLGLSADPKNVQSAAARGVSGGGGALPFLDQIQAAFGGHDLSGVRAHVGGAAADAASEIGAQAYATGNDVAFAAAPDLFTAAHEAAHVVQQRAGVQLLGGVGEAGDAYEQHADEVASAVVRGESAAPLLAAAAPLSGAVPAGGAVQRKEDLLRHAQLGVEKALDDKENAPPVNVRFRGVVVGVPTFIANPDDLIRARADIIARRAAVRGIQTQLAFAAGASVQNHPAMNLLPGMRENKDGTVNMELPSSFVEEPPTPEVAMYVAGHFAMIVMDSLHDQMANVSHERNTHFDDEGNQGTPEQLARLYWMRVAQQGLAAVTGSLTGGIAAHVASLFTKDPKQIAGWAAAGAAGGAIIGGGKLRGAAKASGGPGGAGRRGGKGVLATARALKRRRSKRRAAKRKAAARKKAAARRRAAKKKADAKKKKDAENKSEKPPEKQQSPAEKELASIEAQLKEKGLSGKKKRALRERKKALKKELGAQQQTTATVDYGGLDPNAKISDLLKGTGQLAALARNPNLKGVDTAILVTKTIGEARKMMNDKQWKTFMKHFEGRDLRHGK